MAAMNDMEHWQDRLRAASAKSLRRRQARATERAAQARRRTHGLIDRQAARLALIRERRAKQASADADPD
jgi:hypothetical protein